MNVIPIHTRVCKENDDLVSFIREHVPTIKNGSVLCVTSKIVALSEGRVAEPKNEAEKVRIIEEESEWMVATKYVILTMRDGIPMANAGTDESNAGGKLILLPKDSFASAERIRAELKDAFGIEDLGVIVTDSRVMPLRSGVVGVAVGYAGIKGTRDYRGKPDMFGRNLKYTQTNIADALATTATLVGGEGSEQIPLVLIEDAPVTFSDAVDSTELTIDPKEDMYRPFFGRLAADDEEED